MRTRVKKKIVASDRARRENVPRHILFYIDFAVARGLPFVGSRSLAAQNFVHAYRVSFEPCRNLRSKTTFQLPENVLYI